MGLAASQVRLLTLTSRQHSIEGEAQRLMANKLRLSNDSDTAYMKYMNALDATFIKAKQTTRDGNTTWVDGSINNLLRLNSDAINLDTIFYVQDMVSGKLYMPKHIYDAFEEVKTNSGNVRDFVEKFEGIKYSQVDANADIIENYNFYIANGYNDPSSTSYSMFLDAEKKFKDYKPEFEWVPNDEKRAEYYEEIYKAIINAGGCIETTETQANSASWVNNMIKNSLVSLAAWDYDDELLSKTSAALNVNIREVNNDNYIERVAQEYEDTLTEINKKDTQFDKRLAILETERNAITEEMESLKNIANNNVERYFKAFG